MTIDRAAAPVVDGVVTAAPSRVLTTRASFARRLVANRLALAAVTVLAVIAIAGLLAPWLAPFDPLDQDLRNRSAGPSTTHWLGTDNLGRDLLSRLIFGARIALVAVAEGVGVAVLLGVPIGLFIGYRGGWWDRVVMRVVEAVVSIPGVMLVIVIVTVLGTGLTTAMIALGVLYSTQFVRLCRGLVIAEREEEYVRAAWVLGAGPVRITARHLLPNIAGPVIVQTTLTCGAVLLAEAGLSFLGLAVQPPEASWGTMLSAASQFLALAPWQAVPPGLAIFFAVLAINVVGDAMRDALGRGVEGSRGVLSTARTVSKRPRRATIAPAAPATGAAAAGDGAVDDAVLSIEGLEIRFPRADGGAVPVVTDVSLRVGRGECLGLVGESGSGKTLTALAALGMVPPPGATTAGVVRVDGRSVLDASPREMTELRGTSIAMVFQDPTASLNPTQRVGRQLTEILRVKRGLRGAAARQRAIELLDLVGIPDAASRFHNFPHEFSGGMVQRIAIARALTCDPALLIADEPTTALDVTVQAEILELLRSLQVDLGMAMLFVSHDLGVVAEVCDRAAVMYAGQIVEEAPVDELLTRPRHPYTEALLRAVPRASTRGERLRSIPGVVPAPGTWGTGCRFAPRCADALPTCDAPQSLTTHHGPDAFGTHLARCARADELTLVGVGEEEVSHAGGR